MLVLSRKNGESLVIHVPLADGTTEEIRMQVVATGGKSVRLGIEAQKKVKIYRQELLDRQRAETDLVLAS